MSTALVAKDNKLKAAARVFEVQYSKEDAAAKWQKEQAFALTLMKDPKTKLDACDPNSIGFAVAQVAMLDLTLNPAMKLAYLINRGGKATLDVSYQGLIELSYRSGKVKGWNVGCIYKGDTFEFQKGTGGYLIHRPELNAPEQREFIAAYAVVELEGAQHQVFELCDMNKIRKHMALSPGSGKPSSPWQKHFDRMAIKTAIRTLYPLLPKTEQMSMALNTGFTEEVETVEATTENSDI